MTTQKKKEFIINTIFYGIIIALGYLFFKYIFKMFLPFAFGFLIILLVQPLVKKIVKKLKMKSTGKINLLILVLIYGLIIFIVFEIILTIVLFISRQVYLLPEYYDGYILPALDNLFKMMEHSPFAFLFTSQKVKQNVTSVLASFTSTLSQGVVLLGKNVVTKIPSIFISMFITIIASVFIASDFDHIHSVLSSLIPSKVMYFIYALKDYVTTTLTKVFYAYIKIMAITFIELMIGFTLLQVESPMILSLAIAVFDIIPILGTGGILIPWGLFQLLAGSVHKGIGLLCMYGIIAFIRNMIEPKIIGEQIGVHPVLMLIGIYIGAKVFGFYGMFLVPIIFIIVKDFIKKGIIPNPLERHQGV